MNPKRPGYFYKLTADQLGIKEELVRDALEMYWKEIRTSLTGLKHHSIHVKGLGTFKIKHWKLPELKEKYELYASKNTGDTFRQMAMKTELESRIEKITKLQALVQEGTIKKQSIKTKRNDKANLEKQSTDHGGDIQLNIQEGSDGKDLSQENENMQSLSTD